MLDVLARILANPAARPVVEAAVRRVFGGNADDFERLHWGAEDCTSCGVTLTPPAMPDKLVSLGALHAVEYYTTKGDEQAIYRHPFGRHDKKTGAWLGPRPVLSVGFYAPESAKPPELFIARGRSPYRITTHGIEG